MTNVDAQPPPPADLPGGPMPPPAGDQQDPARPARLTRSRDERMIGGVAGGIAQYLGIDPVIVRLAFVVLALAGGGGVLAYLVAWLVIPEQPEGEPVAVRASGQVATTRALAGGVLVLVGANWLLHALVPGMARVTLPLALILIGVVVVVAGVTGDRTGGGT